MPYFFPEKNDTYINKDSSLFYFKEDMVLFREYYMHYFLDGKGKEKNGTTIFDQSNVKKETVEHFDSLELRKKYKNAKFYQGRN